MSYKKFLYGFVLLLLALLASQQVVAKKNSVLPLEVDFLDVGQGDATLVNFLGNYQILVDGGPSGKTLLAQLGKVMPPNDHQVEVVVLTHPDLDHLAGLIDLAKNYEIGLFLSNAQEADTQVYRELKTVLEEKKIRQEKILEGSEIALNSDFVLKVFNPDPVLGEQKSDRNNDSVVLRLDYGRQSFLFSGDAEKEAELEMLADQENVDVDWLKVSHHGSSGVISQKFLEKVTPRFGIISVGKDNRYHHPQEETLQRLEDVGAEILRTDEKGTIKVECANQQEDCILNSSD